jgi:hypothetical protein
MIIEAGLVQRTKARPGTATTSAAKRPPQPRFEQRDLVQPPARRQSRHPVQRSGPTSSRVNLIIGRPAMIQAAQIIIHR